ncbi:carboxypeptidase Y-deficient [Coemansia brasiliensis]|uniref:Carboxypeptidase Y-deficient n=1 Tax=Coemansia brasiliensis TaxID=2650707 RepID=A0A9W8LYT0_9FUNG|nr:carboxypeptidase Y-deficient [Coemansia brasiliensis]
MSHTSPSQTPMRKEALTRHVRRAARGSLVSVPEASIESEVPPQVTRATRSQSASGKSGIMSIENGRRSTVSLGADNGTASAAAVAAERLRCPICGVAAPSLFALNLHLDDTHFAGESNVVRREAAQDDLEEVKSAILGLFRGAGRAMRGLSSTDSDNSADTRAESTERRDGADSGFVTREHWQQEAARCGEPACGAAPTINCRLCGRLMCAQHCTRQLRLSATAQVVGRSGYPCRVCNECAIRTALVEGQTRSHTRTFTHLRRRTADAAALAGTRIERRLERLAVVHGEWQRTSTSLIAGARRRALQDAEQTVVVWQDDAEVSSCFLCERAFGLAARRHHCRLCGRVLCNGRACSTLLAVPLPQRDGAGFSQTEHADIRSCRECTHVVERHRDRIARAAPRAPELMRLYEHIRSSMALVEEYLPTFNALAIRLHRSNSPGSNASPGGLPDLPRAARIRKQLTAAFAEMDQVSKRIAMLPAASAGDSRLHSAIRRAVAQYLQLHMFPLTMLPRPPRRPASMLGSNSAEPMVESPAGSLPSSVSTSVGPGRPTTFLAAASDCSDVASVEESSTANDSGNSPYADRSSSAGAAKTLVQSVGGAASGLASSLLSLTRSKPKPDAFGEHDERVRQALAADPTKAHRIASMPTDEKLASLDVLRDQRQRVLGYIGEAQRERRLEDAASLQTSLDELDIELSLIERSL